jgi:hypothetical protein
MLAIARIGVLVGLLAASSAHAGDAPVIVIPGKAGVPVIINGYDASYAVVEGDWGLDRPGQVPPTIVTGPLIIPAPGYSRSYFPALGRRPGYGRREIEPPPNRRLPPPAQSFERFWGAESEPIEAQTPDQQADVSPNQDDGNSNRDDRRARRNRDEHRNNRDHEQRVQDHAHRNDQDRGRHLNHGRPQELGRRFVRRPAHRR